MGVERILITEELFKRLLANDKAKEIFQDLEVADDDQVNLFEVLDIDESGTLEVPELYEGISKLRGPARRSDMVANQMLVRRVLQDLAKQRWEMYSSLRLDSLDTPSHQRTQSALVE